MGLGLDSSRPLAGPHHARAAPVCDKERPTTFQDSSRVPTPAGACPRAGPAPRACPARFQRCPICCGAPTCFSTWLAAKRGLPMPLPRAAPRMLLSKPVTCCRNLYHRMRHGFALWPGDWRALIAAPQTPRPGSWPTTPTNAMLEHPDERRGACTAIGTPPRACNRKEARGRRISWPPP